MDVVIAGAALAVAAVSALFAILVRRKAAHLEADLRAAHRTLVSVEETLVDQTRAVEERALRAAADTRVALEALIASAAREAVETADRLSAQIDAAQGQAAHAIDALRSQLESADAAVVVEVAAIVDRQGDFLRSDLEARIAQRGL